MATLSEKEKNKKSAVFNQTFIITFTTFLLLSIMILALRIIVIDTSIDTYAHMFINEVSPSGSILKGTSELDNQDIIDRLLNDNDVIKKSLLANKIVIIDGKVLSDPYNLIYDGFTINKLPFLYKHQDYYYIFVAIQILGSKLMIVGGPAFEFTAFIKTFDRIAIITIFLASLSSLFISYFLSRNILRPVISISKHISEININNLEHRIPEQKTIEYEIISNKINSMLDRIQYGYEIQKQFISDVSHELRTPLTSISGYVKMLKRWGTRDEGILIESIESIERSTNYLKDMIEKLLILNEPETEIEFEEFNIKRVVEKVLKLYDNSDYNFYIRGEDFKVKSSKEYLSIIFKIFIENAMKYSPENKNIDIIMKDYSIIIKDNGIGIAEDKKEKIFERFYKEDSARTTKSHGLGLSIAKKLGDKLNINIEVESKLNEGSSFILQFKNDV
ncbi:MAG: two-component system, OmpR family, sensor histidine kinase ArlS [Oceanotoga sp.]|uniref:sensor histidine kinase n=1 Tax=Oceanotoga sp. TaxID=2108366 RepID=UPI00265674EE|nr:HAMP domain-containing sensor histidine kinase [Oceanotoga sp.]MDN5343197.1 two-component system, OmpR family, sensor histidine kinase ArlS [Oceanotoga sp.]